MSNSKLVKCIKWLAVSKSFVIATLLVVLCVFPLPLLQAHKFFLSSILVSVVLFSLELKIQKGDVTLGLFIFWGICSYIWATNGSLVWFPTFSLLFNGFIMLLARNLCIKYNDRLPKFFYFIVTSTLFILLLRFFILTGIFNKNINLTVTSLGYNWHYINTLLVSCYAIPLFVWGKKRGNFAKIIVGLALCYLVIIFKSKGTFIVFILLLLYYLSIELRQSKYFRFYKIGLFSLFFLTFLAFNSKIPKEKKNEVDYITVLEKELDSGIKNRKESIIASLRLFTHSPIIGIGLGNWYNHVFEYCKPDCGNLLRIQNHNLFSTILAELGLIGFGFYILFWGQFFLQTYSSRLKLSRIDLACIGIVLVYLGANNYYFTAHHSEETFCGIELMGFVAVGIVSRHFSFFNFRNKTVAPVILAIYVLCLIWFSYYVYSDFLFRKAHQYRTELLTSINLLQETYSPIFKTTHLLRGNAGYNESIDFLLAVKFLENGELGRTKKYYNRALSKSPNDELILKSYGRHSLWLEQDYNTAKEVFEKVHKLTPHDKVVQLNLAEIAIRDEDYEAALNILKYHADIIYEHEIYKIYLMYCLISSDYYKDYFGQDTIPIVIKQNRDSLIMNYKHILLDIFNFQDKISLEKDDALRIKSKQTYRRLARSFADSIHKLKIETKLFDNIDSTSAMQYLMDRDSFSWDIKSNRYYTKVLNFKGNQLHQAKEIYMDTKIHRRFYDIMLSTDKIKKNDALIRLYRRRRNSLPYQEDYRFFSLLSKEHYNTYKKEKMERLYRWRFNRLEKDNILSEAELAQIKTLVYEYDFHTTQLLIDHWDNNWTDLNEELEEMHTIFIKAIKKILDNNEKLFKIFDERFSVLRWAINPDIHLLN